LRRMAREIRVNRETEQRNPLTQEDAMSEHKECDNSRREQCLVCSFYQAPNQMEKCENWIPEAEECSQIIYGGSVWYSGEVEVE
jgi:hypothetical protein